MEENETPNIRYGQLREAVVHYGFSAGRAVKELDWLLDEDRWMKVGSGFDDIDDFLKTISLSDFKFSIEQREGIAKKLNDIHATQRATAEMLGVGLGTINKDLSDNVQDRTKTEETNTDNQVIIDDNVQDRTGVEEIEAIEALPDYEKKIEKEQKSEEKKKEKEQEIEEQKKKIRSGEMSLPEGVYDIIAIDPPWKYNRKYNPESSRVASPYPEMSQDELKKINLGANDNCILWLWTTHKFIWDAKELLDHWGFEYKATFVWDKEKMGIGVWLRMQCEFCLLGIKGKPLWDVKDMRDILRDARGEHSSKPDIFYEMIDRKFISKCKADFFGRKEREGWEIKNINNGRLV